MMKPRTSFLTRCLALALALVLTISNVTPGLAVKASAAEPTTAGAVIAANYDLTDAEKALLESGYLLDDHGIDVPDLDVEVKVNTDAKTIKAPSQDGWNAVKAEIVVGEEVKENVELTDGEGAYTYSGNAFSVKVYYELTTDVENQEAMLSAGAHLKQAVANMDAVAAQSGNLYILEQAMPELVKFANEGISTPMGNVTFDADCTDAVNAMDSQMSANGGKLDLSVMIEEYEAGSKTAYLLGNNAADMQLEVVDLHAGVSNISSAMNLMVNNLSLLIQMGVVSQELANQLKTLAGVCSNLAGGLAAPAADSWYAANTGLITNGDATLDALVAALGSATSVEIKNPLVVATEVVTANLNMKNVTVEVVLKTVGNDDAVHTGVVTLSDGATAEEIAAEAAAVEAAAIAAWGEAFAAEHFEATYSELPETLTEDITYTITYAPKNYTVTGDVLTGEYPYGTELTLPVHTDETKAYDYKVNGEAYAQGEIIVVNGNLQIERAEGKAYTNTDLYTVVSNNYGSDAAKNILQSGAFKDNEKINVRKPDPADAAVLLTLVGSDLTAVEAYSAAYNGLNWAPYTYGATGTENLFSGNTASWTGKEVKVQYKLELTNFTQAQAQEILDLAAELKAEAADQKSVMDKLASLDDTMGQLNKSLLAGLNGIIDATDFSKHGDSETIKTALKTAVGEIMNKNIDANNQLKIYNMLVKYNAEGMSYYYRNYDALYAEVESLSGYMTDLMQYQSALEQLCEEAGKGEYAGKIAGLEEQLKTYTAMLIAPNAAIDVNSNNLGKLITALTAEGEVSGTATGCPYMLSDVLTALDDSQVNVQVIIDINGQTITVTTESIDSGATVTAEMIETLMNEVNSKVMGHLGVKANYYTMQYSKNPESLIGASLEEIENIDYVCTPVEYAVKIEGEKDQIITIEDLEIDLPKHENASEGWVYKYTFADVEETTQEKYTFTAEQIDELFENGSYTIGRTAVNERQEQLAATFTVITDENGNVIGARSEVDANMGGVMDFALQLVMNSGYGHIELNGEPLMYYNAENELEICVQTLINAMMNDNDFGSKRMIALGKAGKGTLLNAEITLGADAENIVYRDLPYELYLTSVPSQMTTVANGLEKIDDYMTFNANNGVMDVNLNLPEKVYEVYLAALLATGNVNKSDLNAINSEIAYQFLWDYTDIIKNKAVSTKSFTNTLNKIGINKDLTGAEKYFDLVQKTLNNDGVSVNPDKNSRFDMSVTAKSQSAINSLINMLGIDISAYGTYLGMIKEYKYEDATLSVAADANLVNTTKNFQAAVLDVKASGVTNKFDFTHDLVSRGTSGEAAIILLDDVDGNLTFNDATILDLNGYDVNGTITANGTTLIFDSSMDTFNAGTVSGVAGNATIIGGNYPNGVSDSMLPSGFVVENGTVRNVLYTVTENNGDITYWADADILEADIDSYSKAAVMIAADMAVDLALNYYTTASLTSNGYSLYNISFTDIIGWYDSQNRKAALIDQVLNFVSLDDLNGFINDVLDQMLDFATIENAIDNDTNILSFETTTKPWSVAVDHITDGDYITFGIKGNEKLANTFTVGLGMDGSDAKKEFAANFAGGLSDIVDTADVEVEIEQPSYSNKHLTVSGNGSATLIIDVTKDNNPNNDTAYDYEDYLNVLAVVIAHGIESYDEIKAGKLIDAVGNNEAMKAAIDSVTIEDLFNGLKKMQVSKTFAEMVETLKTTKYMGDAEALEAVYHLVANAAGEGLEKLNLTGTNKTLGSLYNDATGYYELPTFQRKADKTISKSGYSLTVGAEITEVTLKIKLFGDECCEWGDVNHDGFVSVKDAILIAQYCAGNLDGKFFCDKRADVSADEMISVKDSILIAQFCAGYFDKFPAEK